MAAKGYGRLRKRKTRGLALANSVSRSGRPHNSFPSYRGCQALYVVPTETRRQPRNLESRCFAWPRAHKTLPSC